MKALVISDSHRNIGFLENIIKNAKKITDFEQIWHLGDDYEDMDKVDFDGIVKKVPGTRHSLYFSDESSRILSFPAGNFEITLVHSPYDIPKNLVGKARVFLYGHLHKSQIEKWGDGILASPGHINTSFDRGSEASFMIFEENGNQAKMTIFLWNAKPVKSVTIEKINEQLNIN